MTIEEKAKRYDEALERAKYYYNEGKTLEYANDIVSDIFPELKENEDERVRKWIINEIKVKHHNLDEDNVDFVDKAIAWLEKQGEQKPDDKVETKFKVGDWVMYKNGACFSDGSISARVQRIEGHKVWLEHGTYVDELELKK